MNSTAYKYDFIKSTVGDDIIQIIDSYSEVPPIEDLIEIPLINKQFPEDFFDELNNINENIVHICEYNNLNCDVESYWEYFYHNIFEISRFVVIFTLENTESYPDDAMCFGSNSKYNFKVVKKTDFSWRDLKFGLDSIEFMLKVFKNDIQKFNDFVKEKYL